MTQTLERPTEYPQDAPTPKRSRRVLKIVLASVVGAAVAVTVTWGGVAYANGVAAERAHIQAVAQQHQVDAAIPGLTAQTAAIGDESDTTSADEVVAAEQEREAAAAKAQRDAAAAAAAKAATRSHSSSGWAAGQAPKGTPIPMHRETDPNNGMYGQMVIEDPGDFCASRSGSTINGVPVCD